MKKLVKDGRSKRSMGQSIRQIFGRPLQHATQTRINRGLGQVQQLETGVRERKQEVNMETMVVLTNRGVFEIAGNSGNPNEYFAKKLERGEASLYMASELKNAHGIIFPEIEPKSLILCETDTGRWYLVYTHAGIITGFEEVDYIEGFNAEEVEAIRTKGFFRDGDAYYITGKELKKEESVNDHELDENAVYYWDDGVDYICQLDKLETASRIPS